MRQYKEFWVTFRKPEDKFYKCFRKSWEYFEKVYW